MPRTPIYDSPQVQAQWSALRAESNFTGISRLNSTAQLRSAARTNAANDEPLPHDAPALADLPTTDDSLAKIAKYVPAEALTITTLGFAAFSPAHKTVWIYLAVGAIANLIYLFGTTLSTRATTPPPRLYFYVLSVAAFVGWSVATLRPVQIQLGMTGSNAASQGAYVLMFAAFIIPLIDQILGQLGAPAAKKSQDSAKPAPARVAAD